MAGEGGSVKNEIVNGKEVVKKSCIVKFRPCKDWRGEYGFDWVREGLADDYLERLDYGVDGREIKWFVPIDPADFDGLTRDDIVKSLENYLKKRLGKNKKGESVFNNKVRQKMRVLRSEHANDNPPFDFETARQDYIWNLYLENYDPDLWKKTDPELEHFNKKGGKLSTDEDNPIEYFYQSSYVTKVCYKIDRKRFGDVWWTDSIEYQDMANGSEEARFGVCFDSVVPFEGRRCHQSMFKDGSGFVVPMYFDIPPTVPADLRPGCEKEVYYEKDGHGIDLYYSRQPEFVFDDGTRMGGGSRLGAVVRPLAKESNSMWFYFEDGNWTAFGKGRIEPEDVYGISSDRHFMQLSENAKLYYDEWGFKRIFLDKKGAIDIINNINVDIYHLLLDDSIDKVVLTIKNPSWQSSIRLKEGSPGFHLEKKNGMEMPYWGTRQIYSWKEYHEDSFLSLTGLSDKLVSVNGGAPQRYCVPELSIGWCTERYRLTFRSLYDAPKVDPEKKDEYNLQLFIKGKCEKLRLEYDYLLFRMDPSGDISVGENDTKIDIKITLHCGPWYARSHNDTFITVWTVDPNTNDKVDEVGKLRVRIFDGFEMKAAFIKVKTGKSSFSSKLSASMSDQKYGIINAMSQMGIHSVFKDKYTIEVSKSELEPFKKGEEVQTAIMVDGKVKRLGELLVDKFVKKYDKEIDMHYEYLFFFLDVVFPNDVAACAFLYKDYSYVVSSNNIADSRMSVSFMAHEVLHRLDSLHSFQLNGNLYHNEAITPENEYGAVPKSQYFSYPLHTTTNIMDYYTLGYSLRKEQWMDAISAISTHEVLTQWRVERAKQLLAAKEALKKKSKKRKKRKK